MSALAHLIAVASMLLCTTGCAVRFDAAGVSRVGLGLWGFSDPPGVDWYLDRPRRDVPDLPAGMRPELPPRRVEPGTLNRDGGLFAPAGDSLSGAPAGLGPAIGDNGDRASHFLPAAAGALAFRVVARCRMPARV